MSIPMVFLITSATGRLSWMPLGQPCRSCGGHTSTESAGALAGLIARKTTMSRLCLGEMDFDSTRQREMDPSIVAAAALTWGADFNVVADRRAQTGISTGGRSDVSGRSNTPLTAL